MSKIGRKPIAVGTVSVEIKGTEVHFKGKNASGVHELPPLLHAEMRDKHVLLTCAPNASQQIRKAYELWGLHRALLANKILGADKKFEKELRIVGLGFKAIAAGNKLQFTLGYSHKIDFELPKEVSIDIDKTGQVLMARSADKEILGHVCSKIRALRLPEPYKGTGIQYATEKIRRKVGKKK
jgi:large subunit ribosomal protein L6